jgi:site-specific DNA-methyltransferase (adenine-specific)
MTGKIHLCDAMSLLTSLPDASVDMIYTDPPFGTGDVQTMTRKKDGEIVSKMKYCDNRSNFMEFLVPHLLHMHRVLKETGTMYLHLDWRWVHYAKVECDKFFGYDNFLNEVIWSYNVGGRGRNRWPRKHDTILVYVKKLGSHVFNWNDIDRIPYEAPEVQYIGRSREEAEKRIAAGQVPTDVWRLQMGNLDKQRLGYPSQKPLKLVMRTILASSNPGDLILDPFGGSGTTGDAALQLGRNFVMCDESRVAFDVMSKRFENKNVEFIG